MTATDRDASRWPTTTLAGLVGPVPPRLAARPHPRPRSVSRARVLAVVGAGPTLELYPTDEAAATGLGDAEQPLGHRPYGPIASHTADALAVFKTVMMGAFLTAVLGFVVVRRHTRTEEDEGRLELLGAGVVGRWSPLAAAVTLATIAVVAASALSAAGLPALGMDVREHRLRRVAWLAAGLRRSGSPPSWCSSPRPPGCRRARLRLPRRDVRAARHRRLRRLRHVGARPRLAVTPRLGRARRGLRCEPPVDAAASGSSPSSLGSRSCAVLDRRDLGAGIIPARNGPRRAGPLPHRTVRSSPAWPAGRSSAGPSA